MAERQFQVVDEDTPNPLPTKSPQPSNASLQILMLSLKVLSQRAVIALADLFTLMTVASVFWLWYSIHEPNLHQIIALTIYALFVLAANVIVRRK